MKTSQQSFTEQLIEHLSAKGMALLPFYSPVTLPPDFPSSTPAETFIKSPEPVECVEFIRLNNNLKGKHSLLGS